MAGAALPRGADVFRSVVLAQIACQNENARAGARATDGISC